MHQYPSLQFGLFIGSSLLITVGYLAMPLLFLCYLPLTRTVMWFGAGSFLGCMGTHLGISVAILASSHDPVGWLWTAEYLVQAACTWGFIVSFHRMLRAASLRRLSRLGRGGTRATAGSP